jgi:hypothetical protein
VPYSFRVLYLPGASRVRLKARSQELEAVLRNMACSCHDIGTKVGFTLLRVRRTFLREQTWGRAVRASHDSREFGALLIWGCFPQRQCIWACAGFSPLIEELVSSLGSNLALYILSSWVMMSGHTRRIGPGRFSATRTRRRVACAVDGCC